MKEGRLKIPKQALLIALTIIILIPVLMIAFEQNIKKRISINAFVSMTDIAKQEAEMFNINLESEHTALEMIAGMLENANLTYDAYQIKELISLSNADTHNMSCIVLTDAEGNGECILNGQKMNVSGSASFKAVKDGGKRAIYKESLSGSDSTEEYMIMAVPIYENGKFSGSAMCVLDDETVSELLTTEAFDETASMHIRDSSGEVIFENAGDDNISAKMYATSKRLFSFTDKNGASVDPETMLKGEGGSVYVSYLEQRTYFTYVPIGINEWYLCYLVPKSAVFAGGAVSVQAICFSLVTILIAILALILVWRCASKEAKRLNDELLLLKQNEERYRIVESFTDTIMFEGDLKKDVLTFNENYKKVYGRDPILHKVTDLKKRHPYVLDEDMDSYLRVGADINNGVKQSSSEYRVRKADGTLVWHRLEFRMLYDKNELPYKFVGKISSIEEQKNEVERLKELARSDSLTKLLNRESIKDKIDRYLSNEGVDGVHAFMLVDIDNFKNVNDSLGHAVGDRMLVTFAQRMVEQFRSTDYAGRIGGDEFVIFLKRAGNDETIGRKGQQLVSAIAQMHIDDMNGRQLSCSVGIAVYNRDGRTFDELYNSADKALYKAKDTGRNRMLFYDDTMSDAIGEHGESYNNTKE